MRLATITNWAYGATVALTLASGTTMLLASSAERNERVAVDRRYALDRVTAAVKDDATALGELARQFVISGSPADLTAYRRAADALGPVENRTRHVRDAGAGADELRSLRDALTWVDALQEQQRQAVGVKLGGDHEAAIRIMFSPEYEREVDRARAAVERFQYRLDQRTADDLGESERMSRLWRRASEVMLAVTGLLVLFVLYFVFRRRVLQPVVKLSDVIVRLAAQDYAAEMPRFDKVDEIGDMAEALQGFRENGIERQRLERERDADRAIRDLMSRMTQRLQACDDLAEIASVVRRFVPEVAPQLAGRLYLMEPARQVLVEASSWAGPVHTVSEFSPLACWGLRRSAPHRPCGTSFDVPCDHLVGPDLPDSLCLPLAGKNGTLGMLYLEQPSTSAPAALNNVFLQMLAENIALALDNLRLRDALRSLAMADALTMLPNRRQLDEILAQELMKAERDGSSLCCAMIDIDHFKRFNDEYGHDAGDAVLRAVGKCLHDAVRDSNLVFRYGGEEFLVLLPDMDEQTAAARAEDIRSRIAALRVRHDKDLGPITASIGLACAPAHTEWGSLVRTADAALLRAKRQGRDRVVVAVKRTGRAVA